MCQARFRKPLLGKLRALTASPAHDESLGIGVAEVLPRRYSHGLGFAADESVAEGNGRIVAMLLIGGAHLRSFFIVQNWGIEAVGQLAKLKLARRAHIQQGLLLFEQR